MLAQMITDAIEAAYAEGKTQKEVAQKFNTTCTTINRLLSGKRSTGKLTIETFDRMFPEASIDLKGAALIHAPQNRGNVVGINNGHMGPDCLSEVIDKILSTEELTAEEKIKVLKVLKK